MALKQRVENVEKQAGINQHQSAILLMIEPEETYEEVLQRDIIDQGIDPEQVWILPIKLVDSPYKNDP